MLVILYCDDVVKKMLRPMCSIFVCTERGESVCAGGLYDVSHFTLDCDRSLTSGVQVRGVEAKHV